MSVAGVYDCVTKSPMGDQASVLTLEVDGDTVTGTNAGAQGTLELEDGKADGNNASWTMNMTVPMPMKLEASVAIDGDALSGSIKAGAFGEMAISGTRQG